MQWILETHAHADHLSGARRLQQQLLEVHREDLDGLALGALAQIAADLAFNARKQQTLAAVRDGGADIGFRYRALCFQKFPGGQILEMLLIVGEGDADHFHLLSTVDRHDAVIRQL